MSGFRRGAGSARPRLASFAALLALLALGCQESPSDENAGPREQAPGFELPSLSGPPIALESYRGIEGDRRVVLLCEADVDALGLAEGARAWGSAPRALGARQGQVCSVGAVLDFA